MSEAFTASNNTDGTYTISYEYKPIATLTVGEMIFLTAVFDRNGNQTIYINGEMTHASS